MGDRPTSAGWRRAGHADGKLASRVAHRIVDDVAAQGWQVGRVLGSEAELLRRYRVSRAVFREAVRLVEHQGVARMRRGPGGGLVVGEPSVESVIDAVVVYLVRLRARLDDVFEVRLVLEELATDLAADRLDEPDIAAIRDLVRREGAGEADDPRELHLLVAQVARNPAIELFVDILNRVSALYADDADLSAVTPPGPGRPPEAVVAHARIAEAVLAGDPSTARQRMRRHLEAEHAWLRRHGSSRQLLDPAGVRLTGGTDKRAEGLARELFGQVARAGWPVGEPLGPAPELMARYGVSRSVVREAVRLLEHHSIATMRRGPGGGLFVTEPRLAAVSDTVALYLDRRGIGVGSLAELRAGVELAALDRVLDKIDGDVRAGLRDVLGTEGGVTDADFVEVAGHDLHTVLARLTGNPVLELVLLVLLRLTRLHIVNPTGRRPQALLDELTRTHARIVEAVLAGDRELARHRMRRHLDAVEPFMA